MLKNVTVEYDNGKTPLRNANLGLSDNGLVLVIGDTGSGKTTLLRLIAGLIPWIHHARVEGFIRVLGLNPLDYGDARRLRLHVSYAPQSTNYAFTYTRVYEELYARQQFLEEHGVKVRVNLEDLAYLLGLSEYMDYKVSWLSGGYKRRLILARALLGPPSLVLLDEPLSDLDLKSSRVILSLLEDIRKHTLLVVAEHRYMFFTNNSVDHMYKLSNGELVEQDVIEEELSLC